MQKLATLAIAGVASLCLSASVSAQPTVDAAEAEDAPITDLAALLEAAEANHPRLSGDSSAIEAAEARLREAQLSPFFQWRAEAGLTFAPEARGTPIFTNDSQLPLGNAWRPVTQVQVRGALPLFTFGKLRNAWRAARAGIGAAEAQRERDLQRIRQQVRQAYFALQLSLDLNQMIGEGIRHLRRAQSRLEEMLEDDEGDVDILDQRRLAVAAATIRAQASENERLMRSSEAALRALTGLEHIRPPDCPMQAVRVSELETARFLEAAATGRPEVRLLEAAEVARQADLNVQRAGYAPDIGIGFRAGYSYAPGVTDQNNPFIQDAGNSPSLGAGLFMRWNLDFPGNSQRVRGAEARLEQLRAQSEEARRGIALEVEVALERYRDAVRREEAWAQGEREGHAWLVEAVQANDLGTAKPKDLVDALQAYFANRASHMRAVFDVNNAAAELERTSSIGMVEAGLVPHWEDRCE